MQLWKTWGSGAAGHAASDKGLAQRTSGLIAGTRRSKRPSKSESSSAAEHPSRGGFAWPRCSSKDEEALLELFHPPWVDTRKPIHCLGPCPQIVRPFEQTVWWTWSCGLLRDASMTTSIQKGLEASDPVEGSVVTGAIDEDGADDFDAEACPRAFAMCSSMFLDLSFWGSSRG